MISGAQCQIGPAQSSNQNYSKNRSRRRGETARRQISAMIKNGRPHRQATDGAYSCPPAPSVVRRRGLPQKLLENIATGVLLYISRRIPTGCRMTWRPPLRETTAAPELDGDLQVC